MHSNSVFSIGLMSGTSLDGLDIIYVQLDEKDYSKFKILASKTYDYTDEWVEKLKEGIHFSEQELKIIDQEYALLLSHHINQFIKEKQILKIDFIASHGHTIFHQPDKGITLQIGDGQIIANKTGVKTVCDFRTQDVQLGGQGAPLVPIGDHFLFSEYASCLNLGGFANISFIEHGKRIAFDICPVNIVLNHYSKKLGLAYDNFGEIASSGEIDVELLHSLNALNFYQKKPPKSLGIEWVFEFIFPLIKENQTSIEDILRTFVEHIAIQISKIVIDKSSVLITGGGVFNSFLLQRVSYYSDTELIIPSDDIVNYKEALIFSFLGFLKVKGEVNCLKSVTGAKKNHSSGVIFNPNNS